MSVKAKRNGRRWLQLYHVSPSQNDISIAECGLDPTYNRTLRFEVWGCVLSKLGWAMQHVVCRHKLRDGSVTIWTFKMRARDLRRRAKGVYTTLRPVCVKAQTIK